MAHFAQAGDGPVLIGSGAGALTCGCGNLLVQGYEADRFLAVEIQCGACGAVTTTDGLAEGALPPRSAVVAVESVVPRDSAMTVPAGVTVVGEAEMTRLRARFQPKAPDNTYVLSDELLDEAVAAFGRHHGSALPVGADLRAHALGWAVEHLRQRMRSEGWSCQQDAPTANAVTHVTGFLHFARTWSEHPLFAAMFGSAGDRGFGLNGLAPFAAAHSMIMGGNRIRFAEPLGYPERFAGFGVASGAGDPVDVVVEVFDRFEYPFGRAWDPVALRAGVSEVLEAAQGRINLRNPGVLVLSPGAALAGFDEALIEAVKAAVAGLGRKNRGLMAVAPVVLRLQGLADPHSVRFGYGFFPIANRHYRGENLVQTGG